MPSEVVQDTTLMRITPASGQGALGKWRAPQGSTAWTQGHIYISGDNFQGCRAGGITTLPRGVCRRVLKSREAWEGPLGKAAAANRTREIRPSGMRGGLAETWAMGVGLRPTGKPVDKPPNPKAMRAALLPDSP